MKKTAVLFTLLTALFLAVPAKAESPEQKKLELYAAVLGRAVACNLEVRHHMALVAAWIEQTFGPTQEGVAEAAEKFMAEAEQNGKSQPRSAEECRTVAHAVNTIIWPSIRIR